ncbi:MAG: hypothetical protein HYY13_09730 [Nitrospirae bacterium]|nr:hypothetical protein [Nitrospirota bacterium]
MGRGRGIEVAVGCMASFSAFGSYLNAWRRAIERLSAAFPRTAGRFVDGGVGGTHGFAALRRRARAGYGDGRG